MRPLVVIGENPHRVSVAHRPALSLTGSSGRNLAAVAGWPWHCYLRHTERINVFMDPVPRWPAKLARVRAQELMTELEGRTIVLCGARVAEAFGLADAQLFTWLHEDWANVAKIPHPSGSNRLWNDPAVRVQAREFLGRLLHPCG